MAESVYQDQQPASYYAQTREWKVLQAQLWMMNNGAGMVWGLRLYSDETLAQYVT